MQGIKPTKTWARKMLPAVRETIDNYERWSNSLACPLCRKARELMAEANYKLQAEDYSNICSWCPWIIYNKKKCTVRPSFLFQKISVCIRRLKGWEKKMMEVIGE